jgi:hypothetical protein
MEWYRNEKGAAVEALRRGDRPDLATTMSSGSLDELVALHQEWGMFAILDELEVQRVRAGVHDELLLHTLATLPFVKQASLSGATEVLFREPAVLMQLGWAPVQIRSGSQRGSSTAKALIRRSRLPADRLLYQDLQGLADGQLIDWTHHRYVRTFQGHKQVREVEVTAADELTSWESFLEAAARYGLPVASLWACLIREKRDGDSSNSTGDAILPLLWGARPWRAWLSIPRKPIVCKPESDWLQWPFGGYDDTTNANSGVLRQCSMSLAATRIFALEEVLDVLGSPVRESLLPDVRRPSSPDAPT